MAAQILAMLDNDLWLTNARAANAAAQTSPRRPATGSSIRSRPMRFSCARRPEEAEPLRAKGFDFYDWGPDEIRLVTSWDQGGEPVDAARRSDRRPMSSSRALGASPRSSSRSSSSPRSGARPGSSSATSSATVPPQWSVAYRFIIAATAMALVATWKGESLKLGRGAVLAAPFLGFAQFCVNFNAVYLAERHITSGVVATIFALLLIPNSPARLGLSRAPAERPLRRGARSSRSPASACCSSMNSSNIPRAPAKSCVGIGLTLVGMIGASAANVFQAPRRGAPLPFVRMLAWSMAAGAAMDVAVAFAMTGPPVFDSRARLLARSRLSRAAGLGADLQPLLSRSSARSGPAKAAYSSVLVPIIAMGFSTALEGYRWTPIAVAGAVLALGGHGLALTRGALRSSCRRTRDDLSRASRRGVRPNGAPSIPSPCGPACGPMDGR